MKLTKYEIICSCVLAFIVGAFAGAVNYRANHLPVVKAEPHYETYRIDFKNKKCDCCGCKPAQWFEFSTNKTTGLEMAQYFCSSCREFMRFKP